MKLTRRGKGVIGLIGFSFVWGIAFGLEAMNVFVISGIVILASGIVLLKRADMPTVYRPQPSADFAGNRRDIEVEVTVPRSLGGYVIEQFPEDVTPEHDEHRFVITDGGVKYRVAPTRRGIHTIGPARIELTDPLGLVTREFSSNETTAVLTYPRVEPIREFGRMHHMLSTGATSRDRHEFDQLREYRQGDAVRDIDWKSSAKRASDPLVVKEFAADMDVGNTVIIGSSEPGGADAMARAVASVSVHLLELDKAVGVETRDQSIPVDTGRAHRRHLLTALAKTEGGEMNLSGNQDTGILIEATEDGVVTVSQGLDREPFGQFVAAETPTAVADGGNPDE